MSRPCVLSLLPGPFVWLLLAFQFWVGVESFHFRPTVLTHGSRKVQKAHVKVNKKNSFEQFGTVNADVAVIGGGPGGSTISWLLQEKEGCSVVLIDPKAGSTEGTWYPNYGEWQEEWRVLSNRLGLPELLQCTTTEWDSTDVFFGGSYDEPMTKKTKLDRAYVRVDRKKMQRLLSDRFSKAGGQFLASKLSARVTAPNIFDRNLQHSANGSTLTLDDGTVVHCKAVIDASGLESRLIMRESPFAARGVDRELTTGYQIAYGFLTKVDGLGPYDESAMTLFDYRTDPFEGDEEWLADCIDRPTFMYVMPLSKSPAMAPSNKEGKDDSSSSSSSSSSGANQKERGEVHTVFWEETSLVGCGARRLSFAECKRRALRRLEHYGINVLEVEEEEFCYIPMGGELPDTNQRVIAFGGAANMVHPSTGYQACRMMAAASDVARAVGQGVKDTETGTAASPDRISSDAYRAMWNTRNRGQRDFQAYGGDFLMRQPVTKLRGFFSAFFSVEQDLWAGFLAGWPGLPHNEHHETWSARLQFALKLFLEMPNDVRLAMILYSIRYTVEFGPNTLLRSLTPDILFGSGPPDPMWQPPADSIGDEEAKNEARRLIREFKPGAAQALGNPTVITGEAQSPQQEGTNPSSNSCDSSKISAGTGGTKAGKLDYAVGGNYEENWFPSPFTVEC